MRSWKGTQQQTAMRRPSTIKFFILFFFQTANKGLQRSTAVNEKCSKAN